MNLKIISLLLPLLQIANAMEPKKTVAEKRKNFKRSLSARIVPGPNKNVPIRTKSKSDELLVKRPTKDMRLASIAEEDTSDNYPFILNEKTINQRYSHGDTMLIWACRNGHVKLTQDILSHDNVLINCQNNYGATALHYSAQNKHEEIITLLIQDHRTDASLINNDKKTTRDVIIGSDKPSRKLRRMLFARIMLDTAINNHLKELQPDPSIIKQIIESIKQSLSQDYKKQTEDDRDLPQSAKLPSYADDTFIEKMLLYRLKK